jgi:hypothetical protein
MKCALCKAGEASQDSHIIPSFVGRWIKESSPTGFLRKPAEPNKRVQDLTKGPLLCAVCEERFSKLETTFSNQVFREVCHKGKGALAFDYSNWFHRFCVSISWRALTFLARTEGTDRLPHGQGAMVMQALDTWRVYLLEQELDIGKFRQHFLILDAPESATGMGPQELAALGRYIKRAVDFNTIHAPDECYIFSKLCDILIVGTVLDPNPKQWVRTEVALDKGRYEPGDFQVSGCYRVFFDTALEQVRNGWDAMSANQTEKILETFRKRRSK